MILVRINHLEFTTESKSTRLSIILFYALLVVHRIFIAVRPYLVCFLQQDLVIFAQRDAENDRRDILETMYPLLSF